ncbi:MAG: transglutaminase family protein, partial [Casimicrobiaceae bacterium]
MRFNPQETTGSRVRLRYSVELHYELAGPAEFLLNVHAAQTSRQTVVEEYFDVTPFHPVALDVDPTTGNRIAAFSAHSGNLAVRYAALVELQHAIADPADVVAESPAALPAAVLRYLYPSRYCQADLVQQEAWDLFGQLPRGYGQVVAIRDWIRANVTFRIGTSNSSTTVIETLRDAAGVCRDFAHTMIAYCRALNFPARIVTGVDYGSD